jgi:hypothetical protein
MGGNVPFLNQFNMWWKYCPSLSINTQPSSFFSTANLPLNMAASMESGSEVRVVRVVENLYPPTSNLICLEDLSCTLVERHDWFSSS